jgi:hypothetical protein
MTDMAGEKAFKLRADQIHLLAAGRGSCIATDMITVGGHEVGFMYREEPTEELDSGWRFTAGFESEDYMDDPSNLEVYDVNTIANYDPAIIPYLDAPHGSAFERQPESQRFVEVDYEPPDHGES